MEDLDLNPKMMQFIPPVGSKLARMWPHGITGEVTYETPLDVHLRVKLAGHTERAPRTAIIVADREHVRTI